MKKIILLLSLITVLGCKSKKAAAIPVEKPVEKIVKIKFSKLLLSEVDNNLKNKAYELGKRVLMTCNTSKFKPFNESEATESVINNITEEKLSKTCAKFRQRYGDFKDLELVEIYNNNENNTTIFRHKALYTKKVANKELRVYMNEENKVSAIKSMDWVAVFDKK